MHTPRYIIYARKSTESADRQVQSIDDQVKAMTEIASQQGLSVVKVYRESKSAKKPANRPYFSQMMEKIERGEVDGIICWKLDRLSRNPVDGGRVQWLLQQGVINQIVTPGKTYLPVDNTLVIAFELGMASQFILDLSKNVKRGIAGKLERGEWPGVAPTGYLNRLEDHTIIPDPLRYPLIRKAWDEMLSGRSNVPAILKKLNNEWGFRSVKRKRMGNTPLAESGLYKLFNSPFYKGILLHEGKEYPGAHQPMVTPEEYDRVQILLGHKTLHRVRKNDFSFTGLIRCGECGCLITAEVKSKHIKETGETRQYTYYHCTRRKTTVDCSQHKVIRLEDLESQIKAEIEKYTILPQFRDWALEVLRQSNGAEIEARTRQYQSLQAAANIAQKKLDNLTKMRYSDLIGDEEFTRERDPLQGEIKMLRSQLGRTETQADEWLILTEQVFDFATNARTAFANGSSETKRGILMALGQNPTIKDRKLTIEPHLWLQPIRDEYPAIERQYRALEPTKKVSAKTKSERLKNVTSSWHGH